MNVSANRSYGRVLAENISVFRGWAKAQPSFAGLDMDIERILSPTERVGPSLPFVEWADSHADISGGCWHFWKVAARFMMDNEITPQMIVFQ